MQSFQVCDAKAHFSKLVAAAERGQPTMITRDGRPAAVMVAAAERGQPTMITRDGRPAAVMVPVDVAIRLYPETGPSFVEVLLSFSGEIEFERNHTPVRDIHL